MGLRSCLHKFRQLQTLWLSILVPILAAPLPVMYPTQVGKCGYCVIVIGIYWVTEVIPLAVTSLLPVVLFPLFGVMSAKAICRAYVQDTLMLFLGSLIVAVAVEKWNLHKRLALRTLTLVGPEPKWLLLGVMLPTWLLSMWMSNTATTAMMMPIVTAILLQIKECQHQDHSDEIMLEEGNEIVIIVNGAENNYTDRKTEKQRLETEEVRFSSNRADKEKQFMGFAKTFSLATAFSSNIGGVATLTGTPPNVIFKGLSDGLYQKYSARNPVDFANWLLVGIPIAIILLAFLWLWMQMYSQGLRCLKFWKKDKTSYANVIVSLREEYDKMGKMSFAEILVLINFVLLAALWVTRKPGFIPGWSYFFNPGFVGDSTPAIAVSVLLFILPSRPPRWLWSCRSKSGSGSTLLEEPFYEPVLDWATVNKRMAWGVLLLMGGGFAMAEACEVSGLSLWMSSYLEGLAFLPNWVIALLLSLLVAVITQVTSNAATTTLFVPIVGELAVRMGVNPLYFMIPCTISSSLAFLLPVATPPNAIVFAAGYLHVKDMVLAGLPVNILSVLLLNLAVNSWVSSLYDLGSLPQEFRHHTPLLNHTESVTQAWSLHNANLSGFSLGYSNNTILN